MRKVDKIIIHKHICNASGIYHSILANRDFIQGVTIFAERALQFIHPPVNMIYYCCYIIFSLDSVLTES